MRPLRVALVINERKRFPRSVGWWSYDVPEFDVVHIPVSEGTVWSRKRLSRAGFDVAVWEDDKAYGGPSDVGVPVAYVIVDSNLSTPHFQQRLQCAHRADLLLIDSDVLQRFRSTGKKIRRFNYCVNDTLAKDWGEQKIVDVCYHAHIRDIVPRRAAEQALRRFCYERNLNCMIGKICNGEGYMRAFNRSCISLHVSSVPQTRAHRVFDVMACRSALLSSQLPAIEGDDITAGVHYVDFARPDDIGKRVEELLEGGRWREIAEAGYELVHRRHTWAARARELREILSQELGL